MVVERAVSLLIVAAVVFPAAAAAPTVDLGAAERALIHAVEASEGIPKDILADASCIGVFPDASKSDSQAGKVFAHGVVVCRRPDGTMGAPAFFMLTAGHATWSFEGDRSDLIVLVMSPPVRQRLVQGRIVLGPGAATIGGPIGRNLSTPAQLGAELLSWSATAGAITGVSLDGNVLEQDAKANEALYGAPIAAKAILGDPAMAAPLMSEYANPAS